MIFLIIQIENNKKRYVQNLPKRKIKDGDPSQKFCKKNYYYSKIRTPPQI